VVLKGGAAGDGCAVSLGEGGYGWWGTEVALVRGGGVVVVVVVLVVVVVVVVVVGGVVVDFSGAFAGDVGFSFALEGDGSVGVEVGGVGVKGLAWVGWNVGVAVVAGVAGMWAALGRAWRGNGGGWGGGGGVVGRRCWCRSGLRWWWWKDSCSIESIVETTAFGFGARAWEETAAEFFWPSFFSLVGVGDW
jgi:hypothetical protein